MSANYVHENKQAQGSLYKLQWLIFKSCCKISFSAANSLHNRYTTKWEYVKQSSERQPDMGLTKRTRWKHDPGQQDWVCTYQRSHWKTHGNNEIWMSTNVQHWQIGYFDKGWKSGHTHFWISSSLVVWHCLWTNSSNSDGRRGRLVEKRSSCLTNLMDEKLEQDRRYLFCFKSYLVAQINFYKCMSPK